MNKADLSKRVIVNNKYEGVIIKIHKMKTGVYRYKIRWYHPSERQPQTTWFYKRELEWI